MKLGLGNAITGGAVIAKSFQLYSISLDGTNDIITTEADDTAAQMTYSFWLKSSTTGANKGVFGHGAVSEGAFHLNWSNKPLVYLGTNFYRFWANISAQDDDAWHHWLVYIDHTAPSNCVLHVDGSVVTTSTTATNGSLDAYSTALRIGGDGDSEFFAGNIDEFAVFTGDKTANSSTYYNSGTPTDLSGESGLVGYWRMEEGTGTSVADSSTNSNAGTLVNGPSWDTEIP